VHPFYSTRELSGLNGFIAAVDFELVPAEAVALAQLVSLDEPLITKVPAILILSSNGPVMVGVQTNVHSGVEL